MDLGKDKYIKFHIVVAPILQVLPICVGLIRAEHHGAVLTRDVVEPPLRYHDDRRARADHYDSISGFLVSTPKGCPDLTFIECPPLYSLDFGLEKLAPELEILTIWSEIENQKIQAHGFEVRRNAERLRLAEASRGYEASGWHWREEGVILSFEQPQFYTQRSIPKRMTRELLASYAWSYGLDAKRHLVDREIENTVLITDGQVMKSNDRRPRTTEFQEAYEKVLALGIGEPEPTAEDHEMARAMFVDADVAIDIQNKAARAFNRLQAKPDITVGQVVAFYEKYHKLLQHAFGPSPDPHPIEIWAADKATQIDPMHPESQRLRGIKSEWEKVRQLEFRLNQLLPDGAGASWPSSKEIQQLVRDALGHKNPSSQDMMAELFSGFVGLCEKYGITLEGETEIPTEAQAMSSSFRYIVETEPSQKSQVTLDSEITPVIFFPGQTKSSKRKSE